LLFTLIDARYNDMKDTVLLDNNEPAQFEATMGPSIISRLNEAGGLIHCNWASFRD
jgi:hypothetical protein